MGITLIIIGILVFLVLVLGIAGYSSSLNTFKRRDIDRRLKVLSEPRERSEVSIVRSRVLSDIPWLNNILLTAPGVAQTDRLLKQANIKFPVGFFLLFSLVLGISGFYLVWYVSRDLPLGILVAGILGLAPLFYVKYRKKKRTKSFERQLPAALESLCRALRAGHAFSAGLQMVAQEFPDPIGPEFAETFRQINYGVPVTEALHNLAMKVDCKDLAFFVVSVGIQRETGGDLAETLDNTAYVIRERFKLLGKAKALAAEGVYSAWVLSLLPFFAASVLYILNRDYITFLAMDPMGRNVVVAALVWLAIGIFIIRKVVDLKV